ncbi:hypothetical protein THIOM_003418 [Candidatus Thiomargarita nelsonii]|uniref:Uncharacterized protein n=1 Tax=Candidatus Thiomargarita nelsonii TaxID=1003181 RepID=A0A176RYI8_9GAMM|nr:hypothetical protein THIOM_003418 [Candidatus Thiomargarita nelsonii]
MRYSSPVFPKPVLSVVISYKSSWASILIIRMPANSPLTTIGADILKTRVFVIIEI